jgi:precorrin-6Y C5,15-methyltransferase (decarboxylating)
MAELPPLTSHHLHVVGIGLDGLDGLVGKSRAILAAAEAIAAPSQHLVHVATCPGRKIALDADMHGWIPLLERELAERSVVLLATGDPLFFGIGRLLVNHFSPATLVFHPHLSCLQLACSRVQIPWQDATLVSLHGRSPEALLQALKQRRSPIAILTDGVNTPAAIARIVLDLRLPQTYRLWVCSQLGGAEEQVEDYDLDMALHRHFPMPNIALLVAHPAASSRNPPILGIPDGDWLTFPDRPGLITKQEVRVLSLSLLQLQPQIVVWDIGAGTGSVAIEIGRLVPSAQVYAIEQTAAGITLIRKNCQRFGVTNVSAIAGKAPAALADLPDPQRIVVGGGGVNLAENIATCLQRLGPEGILVGNFATLEACATAQQVFGAAGWPVQLLQVNLARSVAIATATRWAPLNPVTLLQARNPASPVNA